jgi:hypothetical protein
VDEQLPNRDDPQELVGEICNVDGVDCLNVGGDPLNGGDCRACGGFFVDGDEFGRHETTGGVRGVF